MAADNLVSTTFDIGLRRIQPMDGGKTLDFRAAIGGGRKQYLDGTADDQVDEMWWDSRSLAVGSETHDLQSLTQLDADGNTVRSGISFDEVKVLAIRNTSSSGHLLVGGAAANAWEGGGALLEGAGDKLRLPAGAEIQVRVPDSSGTVTGSSKDLKLEAVTATQTFDIAVAGVAS